MITIRPADFAAAEYVATHMRKCDVQELRDIGNIGPFEAVLDAMELPGDKWAAYIDGVPAALFGCTEVTILGKVGSPWMLGTDDAERGAVQLVKKGRRIVRAWASRFDLLENVVDGRNYRTVEWLKRLGFTFDDPVEVKPGVPAMRFWMRTE
jgi:hypothetical protein